MNHTTNTYDWERHERAVTLTDKEWTRLTTYIQMSKMFRKDTFEFWEKLANEKEFKNAKINAEFWRETDAILEQIIKKIDG